MFGDNKSVVERSSIPTHKLHKRHLILSYHRVREAVASNFLYFLHIPGVINPSDILRKAWGIQQVWGAMRPLLFWEGDTMDCDSDGESS